MCNGDLYFKSRKQSTIYLKMNNFKQADKVFVITFSFDMFYELA